MRSSVLAGFPARAEAKASKKRSDRTMLLCARFIADTRHSLKHILSSGLVLRSLGRLRAGRLEGRGRPAERRLRLRFILPDARLRRGHQDEAEQATKRQNKAIHGKRNDFNESWCEGRARQIDLVVTLGGFVRTNLESSTFSMELPRNTHSPGEADAAPPARSAKSQNIQ
jgi:hypothetical protein